jgi:HAD superfamily hydrolase (TIGR01509 family)
MSEFSQLPLSEHANSVTGGTRAMRSGNQNCLVIFDCDGVLVDSERLSAVVMRDMADEEGIAFSAAESLQFLRGKKVSVWIDELASMLGHPVTAGFEKEFRARCQSAFREKLEPVPHVRNVLHDLTIPFCVASSAPLEKVELTLSLTGLRHYFGDRIFSGYEIGSWKPDPGIFLHAAAKMHVPPDRCLVIEDSEVGVMAARAAGMQVLGYEADQSLASLRTAGAHIFHSMKDVGALIQAWSAGPDFLNQTPEIFH